MKGISFAVAIQILVFRMGKAHNRPSSILLFLLAVITAACLFRSCRAEQVPAKAHPVAPESVRTFIDCYIDTGIIPEDCAHGKSSVAPSKSGPDWHFVKSLDIFVFDINAAEYLDTYTRTDNPGYGDISVLSSTGDKRIAMIANAELDEHARRNILSYGDLKRLEYEYSAEDPDNPVMYGECIVKAGAETHCEVKLKPVMAVIVLEFLNSEPDLTNPRAYLVNASNRCRIVDDGAKVMPSEFLNPGELREDDLKKMAVPRMAYCQLKDGRRSEGISHFEGGSLYCYPNNAPEESAGSPFTKVIIEGEIEGITVTYEIDVNGDGSASQSGMRGPVRNTRYILDIDITEGKTASALPASSN